MQKMTKGHNFAKNMTIENPVSHMHLQIIIKVSAKFHVNHIKQLAGVVGTKSESARAITPSKMAESKFKNCTHILIP